MNFRRQRRNAAIRDLLSTVAVLPSHLIQPYFIYEGLDKEMDLPFLHGQKKHTLDSAKMEMERGLKNGVYSPLLFIIPSQKKEKDFNYSFDIKIINNIKESFGDDLLLFTDLCLCSHTHTGHCGILNGKGEIDNALSVEELIKKAYLYAQAGSDVIAPSDMMDDRVMAIRNFLDERGFSHKLIMSYSTKFSSNFYGPFREAAQSKPRQGDRKSYQIDPRHLGDAVRCSVRDAAQGADIIMVKPAGAYLDIIYRIKNDARTSLLPLCAYQVSGEYQGLHVMAEAGLFNFKEAYLESLIAIKRAGADVIITYGANDYKLLREGSGSDPSRSK